MELFPTCNPRVVFQLSRFFFRQICKKETLMSAYGPIKSASSLEAWEICLLFAPKQHAKKIPLTSLLRWHKRVLDCCSNMCCKPNIPDLSFCFSLGTSWSTPINAKCQAPKALTCVLTLKAPRKVLPTSCAIQFAKKVYQQKHTLQGTKISRCCENERSASTLAWEGICYFPGGNIYQNYFENTFWPVPGSEQQLKNVVPFGWLYSTMFLPEYL